MEEYRWSVVSILGGGEGRGVWRWFVASSQCGGREGQIRPGKIGLGTGEEGGTGGSAEELEGVLRNWREC